MKKSVSTLIRNFSILITAFVVLSLTSCAGLLQKTGSVSFVIDKTFLSATREAREGGDGSGMQVVVSLEGNGGYGIRQTIFISMEDYEKCMQTDRKFEANFDSIPAGKTYYAYIRVYSDKEPGMTGGPETEPILIGKSKAFKVKAGENIVDMKAFSYRCEYDFSLEVKVPEGYIAEELQNLLSIDVILADSSVAQKLIAAGTDKYKLYDVFSKNALPSVMNFNYIPDSERITFENDGSTLQIEGKIDLPVDENTYGTCGKEVIFIASAKNYEEPAPYLYGKSAKVTPVKGTPFETSFSLKDTTITSVLYDYDKEYDNCIYNINGLNYEGLTRAFCFDAEGYFYSFMEADGAYQLISNKKGFQVFPFSSRLGLEFGVEDPVITIDKQLNEFYATFDWDHGETTDSRSIYRFCSLLESGDEDVKIYNTSLEGWKYIHGQPFVVNNEILYTIAKEQSSDTFKLVIIDLSKATLVDDNNYAIDASALSSVDIGWNNYNFITNMASDMVFTDNAVYILINDSDIDFNTYGSNEFEGYDSHNVLSRGVLIKYTPSTKAVSNLGWSTDKALRADMTDVGMYIAYENKLFYRGQDTTQPYVIPITGKVAYKEYNDITHQDDDVVDDAINFFPSLFMPNPLSTSLSEQAFYGPDKIIGILPKKLVIADDGIAVYIDSNNALRYKNVNRKVIIDLERFAFESVSDAECSFAENNSNHIKQETASFDPATWESNGFTGTKYQNTQGSDFEDRSYLGSLYLAILPPEN